MPSREAHASPKACPPRHRVQTRSQGAFGAPWLATLCFRQAAARPCWRSSSGGCGRPHQQGGPGGPDETLALTQNPAPRRSKDDEHGSGGKIVAGMPNGNSGGGGGSLGGPDGAGSNGTYGSSRTNGSHGAGETTGLISGQRKTSRCLLRLPHFP